MGRVICDSRVSARPVLGLWQGAGFALRLAGGGRGVHGLWCGMGWRSAIGTGGAGSWRIIVE